MVEGGTDLVGGEEGRAVGSRLRVVGLKGGRGTDLVGGEEGEEATGEGGPLCEESLEVGALHTDKDRGDELRLKEMHGRLREIKGDRTCTQTRIASSESTAMLAVAGLACAQSTARASIRSASGMCQEGSRKAPGRLQEAKPGSP